MATTTHLQKIAIVGAGGQSGGHVVAALQSTGKFTLTAITRSDSTNKLPEGVRAAPVDYNSHESLVNALKGQDALIITLAVTAPPETQGKLVAAAAEAGVKWIMPNELAGDGTDDQLNKDTIIGVYKPMVHQAIEKAGLSWLAVATGFWYEFSLAGGTERFGFDLKNRKVQWMDGGEETIQTVTTFAQAGRAVAALFSLPFDAPEGQPSLTKYRNRYVHVASFRVTQKDIFASLLRASGTKESDWEQSHVDAEQAWKKAQADLNFADMASFSRVLYWRFFLPDAPGDFEAKFGLDNKALGLPVEELDDATKLALKFVEEDYHTKRYGPGAVSGQ